MSQNNIFKGLVLVGLGATSYGMLATFVKLAYGEGYTTAEVTSSQFILGLIGLLIINAFRKQSKKAETVKASNKDIKQLMLAGTSLGFTSLFYYLAVRYIPVSIGIVMLMQTVWMGVVLEGILSKSFPSARKTIAAIIVLAGTVLATNLIETDTLPDWRGVGWGLLAAASFTTTMFTANKIALHLSTPQRSLYMLMGGAVIVFGFAAYTYTGSFNMAIFLKWGILLSLFGTIIPPMLMNAGFPHTGLGLGSIVSSLELPVSVTMAYIILNEEVTALQWIGIVLIIAAIVIMNIKTKRNRKNA
ncbi:permease [Flavobacterium suaedae]|uniref:Permease n=1 Tax=Flavobacterium suaedae TaxID=1767027 RepID=A0ABQ1JM30_9FLAO|nr:DMT family transporter [Flavobacterium suaedae]GGB72428.1 permease [Flavobacterium suaedae]